MYGGNPNAAESSPEGRAYDDGVRNASWGLLLHCICSAALSFFVERLTRVYGYKTTFTLGMVTFVFAMMGMVLVRHIYFVNLMAAATGFAYSTITTIPFMLLSKYHADKHVSRRRGGGWGGGGGGGGDPTRCSVLELKCAKGATNVVKFLMFIMFHFFFFC